MPEIVMPRLSDSMEEGTVLRWMKSVGDEVTVGDELVEIETDKANMVYEAPDAGTLTEIIADEGATLPIGEVIGRIGEEGEAPRGDGDGDGGKKTEPADSEEGDPDQGDGEPDAPEAEATGAADEDEGGEEREAVSPPESAKTASTDGRVKASPVARRLAKERGIELSGISGSGPGGRIVKADVEKAKAPEEAPAEAAPAEAKAPADPTPGAREKPETARGDVEKVELTKLQQTVARRMAESKATAPHFYLQSDIDMTRAVAARAAIKEAAGEDEVVPSLNDMVVKACAIALRDHPRANGSYRDGGVEVYSRVNVGVAVAARDALVVPTVFDADRKGLRQIAGETRALATRVREGTISPPELSGGTFTVSNLGMFGISNFHAVINTGQAAILAVGGIEERPVVRGGEVETARMMGVTLACDHRILYGADGAVFLGRIRALLEEPVGLAL
jgi:pyruvate dehydrogenase E2 component (dihydrolipoamide acetyltransferase)